MFEQKNWIKQIAKVLTVYLLIEFIAITLSIYLSVRHQIYLFTLPVEIMSFSIICSRIRWILELLIIVSIPVYFIFSLKSKSKRKHLITLSLVILPNLYSLFIAQFAFSPDFYNRETFIEANKRLFSLFQ